MIDLSPFVKTLDGKPVAVFGLGVSGLATVKALRALSVKVTAWDDNPDAQEAALQAGAEILPLAEQDLSDYACLVLAPGVPLHHPEPHPVVVAAHHAGIEIIGDIEVLHRCHHGRTTIGITGTNGKSTTAALLDHVLKTCGMKAALGGNIGTPVLDLKMPPKSGVFVLELSSFQLDLCPTFTPDIAVLLNITPDHLDRHGTMEEYVAVKARIFDGAQTAIISADDEYCREICERVLGLSPTESQQSAVSLSIQFYIIQNEGGEGVQIGSVHVEEGVLYETASGKTTEVGDLSELKIKGAHNHQNAAAAYAVARQFGLGPTEIYEAMKSFPGLAHRQFLTRVMNGVPYINDSKATNAESTAQALQCHRNIYWIAGGRTKEGGLEGLDPYMDRVRHVFLVGEAMDDFARWFKKHGVSYSLSGTLDMAVDAAHMMAQGERGQPGGAGTVLLSPACSSYDQFKNFEQRGDYFTSLVDALEEEETA